MARTSEAPKMIESKGGESREVHPAYGKITVSSPSGGKRKLFGSNIPQSDTISMVIETAELERKLGTEWVFGNKRILEIEMTHAQYAHMISSIGNGSGTPCTFRYKTDGDLKSMPYIDESVTAEDALRNQFKETISKTLEGIDARIAEVAGIMEKGRATKSELTSILTTLKNVKQQITQNLPFYVSQFNEHVEEQKNDAVMQIEATITQKLNHMGLESARNTLLGNDQDKEST